jgi:hypothetical protein
MSATARARGAAAFAATARAVGTATLAVLLAACGSDEEPLAMGAPMGAGPEAQEQAVLAAGSGNQPPVIESVVLRPREPRAGEELKAQVRFSDPDGDRVTLAYRWTVTGRRVKAGPSLHIEKLPKGARIEVEVVASDGHGESEPMADSVGVGNQPPVVLGVVLEPLGEVTVAQEVAASPRASDPDGDGLEFQYTWWVNGKPADVDGPMLPKGSFRRGDTIELSVVATDGRDESEPLRSQAIEVVNAAPRITSRPGSFDDEGAFRYELAVEDADGDRRHRYHLVEGPEGMLIDAFQGVVSWEPQENQAGAHSVVLEVKDRAGGSDRQSFALNVEFGPPPAAPER